MGCESDERPDAVLSARARVDRRSRRPLVGAVAVALALIASLPSVAAAAPFGLDDVAAKAKHLAEKPFDAPKVRVPEWLGKITYDQWRDIRFRPDQALWKDKSLPFQVQFFHPGLYYDRTVKVNVVDGANVKLLAFSPSQFDYGRNDFASKVPQDLGYAGFRIHAPIKKTDYFDEVIVFLGATYFRAVGKQQVFGMSARGLAIDTALPSGEEFPWFKEFWLVTPTQKAREVTVYALLDSPSLTGAYRFVVQPGEQTTVNVQARLFLRRQPAKIGIAPLTSMFFHGENTVGRQFDDFRPEVHDSDGLLIAQSTGEWIWRPLDNPKSLQVDKFRMPALKGFGLVQRDRDFASYQDLENHSEERPSGWVTPQGDWGAGHVELVQIPTKSDTNDNIAVYWVPDEQPKVGTPYEMAYTIAFYGDDPGRPPGGRTIATRRDSGNKENAQRFVIDFAGKPLEAIPADQVVRGDVTIAPEDDAAELLDQHVVKNPATGGWRLTFQVRPKRRTPIELRAFLEKGNDTLTETWTYTLLP